MIRTKLGLGVAVLAFALFFGSIGYAVASMNQPHMMNARNYLNSALGALNAATANKGGHRKNAINLVNRAINQVNMGMNYANRH